MKCVFSVALSLGSLPKELKIKQFIESDTKQSFIGVCGMERNIFGMKKSGFYLIFESH